MPRPTFNRDTMRLIEAIEGVFATYAPPLTVRQVYYQIASQGLVPLSHKGYRKAQAVLLKVREHGIIPWHWFADRTRERIQSSQWKGVAQFAKTVRGAYRRDYWETQPTHVEVWLEKDAMSQVVREVLDDYGVPLYVARGFSSVTFVHEAAEALNAIGKPSVIFQLGDHDPSGVCIDESLRTRLAQFGVEATFRRLAVNLEDIDAFNLLPLEAKATDSRYSRYVAQHGTATVELDALPPDELRRRIRDAVEGMIDADEWRRMRNVEAIEQATVDNLATQLMAARS